MLTVAVQAGGESSRMGQNKALMPFLGRPLIERVIERVRPIADELLVTSNEPHLFRYLNLPLYLDLQPGTGALGGLLTALTHAGQPYVAVVACDMPFVNSPLLKAELGLITGLGVDVVIPDSGDGYEPFHALYRREPCLAAIEAALAAGKRRMISWLSDVNVLVMSREETAVFDPKGLAFLNVNTQEEFGQAELQANQFEGRAPLG